MVNKDVKYKKISEGKLRYSRKINSDGMTVAEWIEYHQGKHFCQCGCGSEIVIKAHHHNPYCSIPKYISGHNMKIPKARKKARIKALKQLESGNIKPLTGQEMKGRHHTEETKKQMYESALKWIIENPELAHERNIKAGNSSVGWKHTEEWVKNHTERMKDNPPMLGRHHTVESRIKNSCSHRGISVEDFNGFSEQKKREFYGELLYNDWRTSVFERDNYTCQMCNNRGGYLEGHHILPVRDYPEFIINEDNGITICRSCHRPIYPNEMDFMAEFIGKIFDNKARKIWN
jgi:hypothetical protein